MATAKKKTTSKKSTKYKSKDDVNVALDWKSPEAREAYVAEMAKKGATLPKGFIKDAKANTGH
tara:strand:+ start:577 stop:765 length:189 start_codon:yes stop_codon:yes gene_type:complete